MAGNTNLDFPRGYHLEIGGGMRMPSYGFGFAVNQYNKFLGEKVGGYGELLRDDIRRFFGSRLSIDCRGESIAQYNNYCELDPTKVDEWGMPVLRFNYQWTQNEIAQARHMQDTYYLNNEKLLRTHTSASQIHFMEENDPPIKIISPGRVYRNEDISVRSYCLFHQIEGLYVDKKVSFSDLKGVMEFFSKKYFGQEVKVRFRPSYFPFTEPSAEMDIYWGLNSESDYRITKGTGWLEILGCGMVDPEVFKSVKYDSSLKGYAFGIGIERIAMLKYGITDIRLLYEGDIRFLRQF